MEPVDYQSADLEKDVYDHVEVLGMNPTKFDVAMFDDSAEAQKAIRPILLWHARTWEDMDENRWWDRAVGEGQVRHGVKVMWLRWRSQIGDKRPRNPFYWSNTNIYGCYWTESDNEVDAFYYRYTVPILESGITKEGKKLTLDNLGKLGWLGLHEEHGTYVSGKMVEVIIRDARDLNGRPKKSDTIAGKIRSMPKQGDMCGMDGCDHPKRTISIYVCPKDKINETEYVEEYDSPFPGCSFFVIGGRVSYHETDMHQKYRPLMLPSYNEQYYQNYLKTILSTMARKDYGDEDVYLDGSTVPPHIQLPEGGAQQNFDRPEPGSNKVPFYPAELKRWPKSTSPHLMTLLQRSEEKQSEFRPNRFVIGTAFTEASNATGTAFLQQAQQAALPYNGLLGNSDAAIKKACKFMRHAIRYWAQADGEDTSEYPAVLTGSENVMRYGGSVSQGELVTYTSKMASYDFDMVLKTSSQTLAEAGARWLQAKDKYFTGIFTVKDLMKEADIFDVEAQVDLLYAESVVEDMAAVETRMQEAYLVHKASAETGLDFNQFMTQPVNGSPAGSGQQVPPQNGGSPGGGSNGSVQQLPPNALMGRSMNQAVIEGPSGGASPLA